ncbi:MAG: hypothetical protein RSD57_13590 [Comamonas sp.]
MPTNPKPSGAAPMVPARPDANELDFMLSNHQLRTAIMNTVNCLRPSVGSATLNSDTTRLLNDHLAALQEIERQRAAITIASPVQPLAPSA